jgi:hypothetical protein
LGNAAEFSNTAEGTVDLVRNADIAVGSGLSVLRNAGTLTKISGKLSTIAVDIVNDGTIGSASGLLQLQGDVTGHGMLGIAAGKALQVDGAVKGQTVDFNGGGDRLILTDAATFDGTLKDFGTADSLDLREFDPGTTTIGFHENGGGTAGILTVSDGARQGDFLLLGQYASSGFETSSDGLGGTTITYVAPTPLAAPTHD